MYEISIKFCKEEKFRETSIGKIPEDWEIIRLGSYAEVFGGTTPSKRNPKYWNGNIYWATPTDITNLSSNFISETAERITEEAVKACSLKIIEPGNVLLTSRATIGFAVINMVPITINQGITAIIPNKKKLDSLFLVYLLRSMKNLMEQLAGGSTFREISRSMIKSLRIPLPPLSEQKAIAHILSTVDEAIQKTNEIIEKTKRLKKGLMQELLTKGIGHKKFKDTEIGRIPKEWKVLTVKEMIKLGIIEKIEDGNHGERHPKSHEFTETGIPFITVNCIKYGRLDFKECKYLPPEVVKRLVKGFAKPGDVLLTHKGTIGLTAIVPSDFEYVILSPQVTYYRIKNHEKLLGELLYYVFQTDYIKHQLIPLSKQSTRAYVSLERQSKLKLPLPPLEEQRKIVKILSAVDKRLEVERKRKEKLERIKKSLMDLLLTGKIRVKVVKHD